MKFSNMETNRIKDNQLLKMRIIVATFLLMMSLFTHKTDKALNFGTIYFR